MASGYNKKMQIELQNLIFNTNEKKLMVSSEFLEEMTKQYISKRMKTINQTMEGISATKNPKNFFTYYDTILKALDELIMLEPYHQFNSPEPSAFKKNIQDKKSRYVDSMINRVWKDANMKAKYDLRLEQSRNPEDFNDVFEELLKYRENYSEGNFNFLNRLYTSVFGYGIDEQPEPEEELTEDAEILDENTENIETTEEVDSEE